MNCSHYQRWFVDSLYDELSPSDEVELRAHLESCRECGGAFDELEGGRRLLDSATSAEVAVDVPGVLRAAMRRAESRRRRWRGGVLAAALLIVVVAGLALARVRVDWSPGRLVFSWGGASDVVGPASPSDHAPGSDSTDRVGVEALHDLDLERLQSIEGLVRQLAVEIDFVRGRQEARLSRLQHELRLLGRENHGFRKALERDVRALYAAQYPAQYSGKGD